MNKFTIVKFYMAEFYHKKTKTALIKFGVTRHLDALQRFSVQESIHHGRSPSQYNDFRIRILLSIPCSSFASASKIENEMLKKWYPKRSFRVEEHLGLPTNYYDNMSGVTEIRYLTKSERKQTMMYLKDEYMSSQMLNAKKRSKKEVQFICQE